MSPNIIVGATAAIIGTIVNTHGAHLEEAQQTVALRAGRDGQALVTNVGNIVVVPKELPNGLSLSALLEAIEKGEVVLVTPGAIANLPEGTPALETIIPGEELVLTVGRGIGINIDHERVEDVVRSISGRDLTVEEIALLRASLEPEVAEEDRLPTGDPPPEFKLPGVSKAMIEALTEKGLGSVEALRKATDAEILAIEGIGDAVLARIRKHLADTAGEQTE